MSDKWVEFLSEQLYPDLKSWSASLFRRMVNPVKKARSLKFHSINALIDALKKNIVTADEWVTLECKPSLFGPFLRTPILSTFIGHHTSMRLGPPIISDNPMLGMFGQITTQLKPVGIYPPIDNDLYQLCLYPSDANAYGMMGLVPGINELVPNLVAVANLRNIAHCNVPCHARGIVRQVSPQLLIDIGVTIERWEELRQAGGIWFLDLAADDSEVVPISEATTIEMWGGLYANGHIEIESGELKVGGLLDGMVEALRTIGFEPNVTQNKAGNREYLIYAQGIRILLYTHAPLFAIHMDAELALDYSSYRGKFDILCNNILDVLDDCTSRDSVNVANPRDLDFSYTDSAKSFAILSSAGAENIADPVAVAIRDWHRKKNMSK